MTISLINLIKMTFYFSNDAAAAQKLAMTTPVECIVEKGEFKVMRFFSPKEVQKAK